MASEPNWCALLEEARAAYHDLIRGKAVVSFRDQNNEQVTYGAAKAGDLKTYIDWLEGKCNPCVGRMNRPRPIGFVF